MTNVMAHLFVLFCFALANKSRCCGVDQNYYFCDLDQAHEPLELPMTLSVIVRVRILASGYLRTHETCV